MDWFHYVVDVNNPLGGTEDVNYVLRQVFKGPYQIVSRFPAGEPAWKAKKLAVMSYTHPEFVQDDPDLTVHPVKSWADMMDQFKTTPSRAAVRSDEGLVREFVQAHLTTK